MEGLIIEALRFEPALGDLIPKGLVFRGKEPQDGSMLPILGRILVRYDDLTGGRAGRFDSPHSVRGIFRTGRF
jgi:hypothetical protein